MYSAEKIAQKLIMIPIQSSLEEDLITNQRLQKLLYYEQGFHLAKFDTPLFKENFVAWKYGPVIPSVHEKYKHFGRNGIVLPEDTVTVNLPEEEEKLFYQVYETFSRYSAIGLAELTHQEKPWQSAKRNDEISKEVMKEFFKTLL